MRRKQRNFKVFDVLFRVVTEANGNQRVARTESESDWSLTVPGFEILRIIIEEFGDSERIRQQLPDALNRCLII